MNGVHDRHVLPTCDIGFLINSKQNLAHFDNLVQLAEISAIRSIGLICQILFECACCCSNLFSEIKIQGGFKNSTMNSYMTLGSSLKITKCS